MNCGALSDIGKVRKDNEDSFYVSEVDDKINVYLIADGIGGQNHGKLASMMTIQNLVTYMRENFDKVTDKNELLDKAVKYTNTELVKFAHNYEDFSGMGSTLVALYLENGKGYITHAGDSRCYMIRNGFISQITVDNSYVEYLLQKGVISTEEAKNHPQKNLITKAIGMEEEIDIELDNIETNEGDIFLLCSDGLTSMLSDEIILHIIQKKKSNMQKCAEDLVKAAKANGGHDNITVILVEV